MAVIIRPGVQADPVYPSTSDLVEQLRGQLTLADVADDPDAARYAVSSVDAANVPILTGTTAPTGVPWPTSAGVTSFNGFNGSVAVPDIIRSGNQNRVALNVAGSGSQVGDQRNLPAVTAANYQSGWSGAAITYTSTPTTAAISVAAGTLYMGNISVAYNASSANVTGTASTTVVFYLYYNDPTYAGGTQTLLTSTNPHQVVTNNGFVNLGQVSVVFPASGTGGGGGVPGCPSIDAWVIKRGWFGFRRRIRAGRVKVGDWLLLVDGRWGKVSFSRTEWQSCRRIETVMGTLTCSASAPMLACDGAIVNAGDLKRDDWLETDQGMVSVTANLVAGMAPVQHITCEFAFFWCRSTGTVWFAHHNMKPP